MVPNDGWWTAFFNPVARETHLIYAYINTAPRWEQGTVHLTDLDLDVTLASDGSVELGRLSQPTRYHLQIR